ncbi:GntR family transcriptional regulator [Methylobacterium sp. V23]|jgi:GntR family transcriptional regulator|uniref:GntR family transcriptional regulator n=1 Tax=Methylobacterium sp. V23 TaxID=2044878 RepID=UPI000CDB1B24|nr:GntR family transcriptional regulator [Methylobacterium sp. V23]POR41119.1 GntR family transcriptional regulator [Methylobacterium sp. V23]
MSLLADADPRLSRYQQLRDVIVARIVDGSWRAGDAIPTEAELSREAGIAVGTVRKAIDLLVAEGILDRVQGRGTFVRRPSLDRSLFRFFRLTDGDGRQAVPQARILSRSRAPCPTEAAEALGLPPGAPALRLERLRLDGATPLLAEEIWLAPDRFAPLEDLAPDAFGDLLYPLYERLCGEVVAMADETLTASGASPALAARLGLPAGAPVMVIERIARGYDRHPIEWRRSHGAAERFRYRVEIR